tara:strand:+ start:336 stop:569 length:234 start_codon:yes stop_codon:yes gene_type:complete
MKPCTAVPSLKVLVETIAVGVWVASEELCQFFGGSVVLVVCPNIFVESVVETAVDEHLESSALYEFPDFCFGVGELI